MAQSHSEPAASLSVSHATETSLRPETSAVTCSGGVDSEVTDGCTASTEACSASTSGSSWAAELRKVSMSARTVSSWVEFLNAVFDNVDVAEVLNRRLQLDAVLAEAGRVVVVGTGESYERQSQDKRGGAAHVRVPPP